MCIRDRAWPILANDRVSKGTLLVIRMRTRRRTQPRLPGKKTLARGRESAFHGVPWSDEEGRESGAQFPVGEEEHGHNPRAQKTPVLKKEEKRKVDKTTE